ncbi:MAG: hypothetical protein ACREQM_00905 [Candidatus Dormibacteraceae bacterium]
MSGERVPATCVGCGGRATGSIRFEELLWSGSSTDADSVAAHPMTGILVCDACRERAYRHQLRFAWCGDDHVWNVWGGICRGGCERRLTGWFGPV